MKYQIYGEKLPIVTLQFEAGEAFTPKPAV